MEQSVETIRFLQTLQDRRFSPSHEDVEMLYLWVQTDAMSLSDFREIVNAIWLRGVKDAEAEFMTAFAAEVAEHKVSQ